MSLDELDLNPRILAAVKKAKLKSVKEVLHFSGPDLQRLTSLSGPDVQYLLRMASSHLRGSSVFTALHLQQQPESFPAQHQRLSLGCPVLDRLLRGGLPLDGITELAGCSSAGKTQLALQLCLAVQLPRRHGGLEAGEWPPPGAALRRCWGNGGLPSQLRPQLCPGLLSLRRVSSCPTLFRVPLTPLLGRAVSLGTWWQVQHLPGPVCTPRQ
ncbi:hypothetical protein MC885_008601 [Smutsia gigantea]|nr:hypothetical protein MC885_008601 [Smutsia gigantea]